MATIGENGSATPGGAGYSNVAGANLLTYGGEGQTDSEALVGHAAEHAAMGIFDDGTPGACVTRSERNISNTVATKVFLPSAPLELAILWVESGTSGNLKFVLEAASDLDADNRLANDAAHGEISSGENVLLRFISTSSPMNIYLLATSAVGVGSNVATILAKVTPV